MNLKFWYGIIIGTIMALCSLFFVKSVFSEAPGIDYTRVTLSNVYDALEDEKTKLNESLQRIQGIQDGLREAARIHDEQVGKE